jgi:hypothetical protein
VVQNYLKHTSIPFPAPGVWNPNGRGYPDVAAVGHSTRSLFFLVVRVAVRDSPLDCLQT